MFQNVYKFSINNLSKFNLIVISSLLLLALFFSKNFNLDASSDALLLDGDQDLNYLREINERYGSKEFLFLTYTPISSFTEERTIVNLQFFKNKIEQLSWVDSVITIVDVPLLKSSDEPLMERLQNYKTLSHPEIDKTRGIDEILQSPIYKDYIISENGKTSAIVVYIKEDQRLKEYAKIKNNYFTSIQNKSLNDKEKEKYKIFLREYENYKNLFNKRNHQNINEIREVISKYGENAKIHLGGIPMIADDMMTFIKNDIIVFGIGVFLFILTTLWFIFRSVKWVLIPLAGCITSVILMIGLLGFIGWKVTVISSNFIALMLILNMAMNIHFTVRYLQLKKESKGISKLESVIGTSKKMFYPILYAVLTTVCAFLSLIFSGIKPIINFGWMMTLGLTVSLLVTFYLLPSLIMVFAKDDDGTIQDDKKSMITNLLAKVAKKTNYTIYIVTFFVIICSLIGILKLEVENSFINYFDKETEIYKGMKKIDDDLGGTTPLDIIIKFPRSEKVEKNNNDDEFEEWEEEDEKDKAAYWFTRNKIDKILEVHDYLDSLPEIGKVLSFGSIIRVAEDLNKKPLQSLEIAVLYSKIPDNIKKEIISPYISVEADEARISVRIKDSLKDLRRDSLIKKINNDLKSKLDLKENEFQLAGVLILFNNLLQSLFKSQILTLGVVMLGISLMFLLLFRNYILAFIGFVMVFYLSLRQP